MLNGLGKLGDMANMMKKAKDMQTQLAALQQELANTTVTGEAANGAIRVSASAKGTITALDIAPDFHATATQADLQTAILAATQDAQTKGRDLSEAEMRKLADQIGLPPGMNLPI
jgi:DNA-binding YbaB/EbfC family protein